jgi:cytochrome bd-type quinol oxidase subunit 2
MKSNNPIQQSAKTAGLAYLLIIVTSILSMILGPYKLLVEGDTSATINNIATNQQLFRAGATYDLLMFIGVIILSVALFNVLKTVNKTIALTALISRIGEALIGSLTVVCSMAIVFLVNADIESESNQKIITLLFDIKDSLMNIVFSFLGFGSILFCYLFYKARYIPRILAAFGILAFVLVFSESIAVLLFPFKSMAVTGVPAILFEIIIGLRLLIKGVNYSE